jgi:hypothetical protein
MPQCDFPLSLSPTPTPGGDFLVNGSQLAFGVRQNGQPVHNVQLPAWASGPDDMLAKHRWESA